MPKKISESDYLEIEQLLSKDDRVKLKEAKIFFDGRQYNLRIPARFAREMEIDPKRDRIIFTLVQPENIIEGRPRLFIELRKA